MVELSISVMTACLMSGLWLGLEVEWLIAEFEAGISSSKGVYLNHHDQSPSGQDRFAADTKSLDAAFQEGGDEKQHSVYEGAPRVSSSLLL